MLDVAIAAAAEVGLDELGDGARKDFNDDAGDEIEGEDEGEAFDEGGCPLDVGGCWVCGVFGLWKRRGSCSEVWIVVMMYAVDMADSSWAYEWCSKLSLRCALDGCHVGEETMRANRTWGMIFSSSTQLQDCDGRTACVPGATVEEGGRHRNCREANGYSRADHF